MENQCMIKLNYILAKQIGQNLYCRGKWSIFGFVLCLLLLLCIYEQKLSHRKHKKRRNEVLHRTCFHKWFVLMDFKVTYIETNGVRGISVSKVSKRITEAKHICVWIHIKIQSTIKKHSRSLRSLRWLRIWMLG